MAQLEVLAALRRLRACVTDTVALATLEAAHETIPRCSAAKKGNNGATGCGRWVLPYCPPRLWSTLRPQWRELTRSAAVLARPDLLEVVTDMKSGCGFSEAAAEPKAGRQLGAASAKKSSARRGRSVKGVAHLV
ncbi:hypothetical protein, conserved [Leishmania tarentolae]|uniref:Uncharacterized protein n=1 Tax=Leishmania tarentolae TaxID=5689 RepID=A0A640KVY9_LEITA|nr:hypothetical protein, conserved [Leishmania tarentolae]